MPQLLDELNDPSPWMWKLVVALIATKAIVSIGVRWKSKKNARQLFNSRVYFPVLLDTKMQDPCKSDMNNEQLNSEKVKKKCKTIVNKFSQNKYALKLFSRSF
jgi:hypothetical protein